MQPTPVEATDSRQAPLVDGTFDDTDPFAVALLREGFPYCTGSLIASDVVLTAAHCIDFSRPELVFFGSRPGEDGYAISVAGVTQHPDYDAGMSGPDLAVVVLNEPAAVPPAPVFSGAMEQFEIGALVRLVGFGATSVVHTGPANKQKRQGMAELSELRENTFDTHPGPAQPCMRDSGGPALMRVGEIEYLAGVIASGDAACSEYARMTRVDREAAFLAPYLNRRSKGGNCSIAVMSGPRGGSWISARALLLVLACARRSAFRPRRAREWR